MSQLATVEGVPIFSQALPKNCGATHAVFFRADFDVDVDGSPRAYGPGKLGRDYLANAGRPGNWWALVTGADGQPIVQGKNDPAPGHYVSTTSLQDATKPRTTPARYVDADTIPYFVLPGALAPGWGVKLGDVAFVQKVEGGVPVATAAAIFADSGPRNKVGEGSPALARELCLDPDPKRGGTSERIIQYFVFAGSGEGRPLSVAQIESKVAALVPYLRQLGGLAAPIGA